MGFADFVAASVEKGESPPYAVVELDEGYVTYLEAAIPEPLAGGYSPGGHDSDYWQRVAPAEAKFIGRALGRPAAG
jgi:hypothetical protein